MPLHPVKFTSFYNLAKKRKQILILKLMLLVRMAKESSVQTVQFIIILFDF